MELSERLAKARCPWCLKEHCVCFGWPYCAAVEGEQQLGPPEPKNPIPRDPHGW